MKVQKIGLFHTPKSWEELQDWINRHSPEDRAHLMTAACMGWNLASKVQEMEEEKV